MRNERINNCGKRDERKGYCLGLVDSLEQDTGGRELYSGRRSRLRREVYYKRVGRNAVAWSLMHVATAQTNVLPLPQHTYFVSYF